MSSATPEEGLRLARLEHTPCKRCGRHGGESKAGHGDRVAGYREHGAEHVFDDAVPVPD